MATQEEEVKQTVEAMEKEQPEEEIPAELEDRLPFPAAAVVRLMKKNMDSDKMIKREVKIEMNKWLARLAESVSKEMNKVPYTMIHLHEFKGAIRMYENLVEFQNEKERILKHLDAIKSDIEKLERDLGKLGPEEGN